MRAFRFPALVLGLVCVSTALLADRDDDRHGPPRVTFFEHADFRGGSITLEAGQSIENLAHRTLSNGANANDRISSIRVEEGAEAVVFSDAGFRGEPLRLLRDVRDLSAFSDRNGGRWNDAISSIRVEAIRGGRLPGPARPDLHEVEQTIRRAYRDVLQREPDEPGFRVYRGRMIDERWSEQQVREALRRTEEFRRMAERIIAKAYRDLLGRAPDEPGRRTYTEAMIRQGWTEEGVRNAIRRSDEYRRR